MDAAARNNGYAVIPTPPWILVLRIFQIIVSVIAVGMAGWWIHGLYLNALGFVIVCGLFTWVIALYTILSERAAGCRRGYNTWAVLALEGTMIVFWLAAMGATADARAAFRYDVVASCVSDGSAVNSGQCTVAKRATVGVASYGALDVLSGIAAACAVVLLLFVGSFAYVCHFFRLACRSASPYDAEKQPATELKMQAPLQQTQAPLQQTQAPLQQTQAPMPAVSWGHQDTAPQTNDTAFYTAYVGSPTAYTTAQSSPPYNEPGRS